MKKVLYVCLPYRYLIPEKESIDHYSNMVGATTYYPGTDGDILRVEYDAEGKPSEFSLHNREN